MRAPGEGGRNSFLTYADLAPRLAEYCSRLGFTHEAEDTHVQYARR